MAGQTNVETSSKSQPAATPGPFLAKVVGHMDPNYMGGLEVEILRTSGATHDADGAPHGGQLHQVKYMSPFYGSTDFVYTKKPKDDDKDQQTFDDTQKSYGMWMIPPDPGTTVIVIFIDGDPKRGYWIGCVQDEHMNFMVPGMAGTSQAINADDDKFLTSRDDPGTQLTDTRLPVAEFNKQANDSTGDTTQNKKPTHPFAKVLIVNGLDRDDIRGITTSSARRETPSAVFGISTPGPIDKDGHTPDGPKKGNVGKSDHVVNIPVSRKGGSTFVMDDGDDKFVRKRSPSDAGPDYVAVEQADGKPELGEMGHKIPHNELIRIRTRTGHQILFHNSEDLIYISHGSGNSWIEMTSNGKIDVYAKDSISFHTEQDFNFHADRDINFQAGGNINIKSLKETKIETVENFTIRATKTGNITIGKGLDFIITEDFNVKAANTNIDGGQIHLNSGKAKPVAAAPMAPHTLPKNSKETLESIMRRVPVAEPYAHHENLNPQAFIPEKTYRDYPAKADAASPDNRTLGTSVSDDLKSSVEDQDAGIDWFKKYTTLTDTFQKIKGSSQ